MPKHDETGRALVRRVKRAVKKSRRKLGAEKFEKELRRTITFLANLQQKLTAAIKPASASTGKASAKAGKSSEKGASKTEAKVADQPAVKKGEVKKAAPKKANLKKTPSKPAPAKAAKRKAPAKKPKAA